MATTAGRKVVGITVSGYDNVVEYMAKRIKIAAKLAGIRVIGPYRLPLTIKKYTFLKSPHVDKKARAQYEIRTMKQLVRIDAPTPIADKFMKFLLDYLPPMASMIDLKTHETFYQPLPKFYTGKRTM
eukprot:TRINITY_DN598_c0_g1_i1.p1 TRINITY_DN598_c0_g1~~TRINITY_DN598_c0_g1_i1.p1  ORF type:complete len:140 (+),score=42.53 TRINITY_DN598_c0_g1_i1:40-420(+)